MDCSVDHQLLSKNNQTKNQMKIKMKHRKIKNRKNKLHHLIQQVHSTSLVWEVLPPRKIQMLKVKIKELMLLNLQMVCQDCSLVWEFKHNKLSKHKLKSKILQG